MANQQVVILGGAGIVNADTTATNNTIPLRDNQGGIAVVQALATELKSSAIVTLSKSATKTTGFTLDATATLWPCDATGGAFAATLPVASTCLGRVYKIKKIDSSANAVTVTASGGDLIDGAATKALSTQWKYIEIQSDGVSAWWIVANN